MGKLAIIGGSGLTQFDDLEVVSREVVETKWGTPSSAIVVGRIDGHEVLFLSRHGETHCIPPHVINYRANLTALRDLGADRIIAIATVGGISMQYKSGTIAIPKQIIDYTWSRQQTFYEYDLEQVVHVDFTNPYDEGLRQILHRAANKAGIDIVPYGVYGVAQGPRFETAAEIERMAQDGCDIVGMTGMPEAGLARELLMPYAHLVLVVNPAAGRTDTKITLTTIKEHLQSGMVLVRSILRHALAMDSLGGRAG